MYILCNKYQILLFSKLQTRSEASVKVSWAVNWRKCDQLASSYQHIWFPLISHGDITSDRCMWVYRTETNLNELK